MTNRALRAIGLISYSLYLWQQLFFGPGSTYDYPWFWSQWPQNIIAAVACASVSYFLVEKPFLRISARLSRIKNSSPDNFSAASSGSSSNRYSVG
jgi:peptidoglycan/LPS O-acetylase OafA/YrhL